MRGLCKLSLFYPLIYTLLTFLAVLATGYEDPETQVRGSGKPWSKRLKGKTRSAGLRQFAKTSLDLLVTGGSMLALYSRSHTTGSYCARLPRDWSLGRKASESKD